MNKEQYLSNLTKNLKSLPKEEREEAMAFYEEYLSDLEESSPGKIDDLDDPSRVAAQIKAEVALRSINEKDVKKKKGISTAWTVLLAIFALPIGLPVAVTIAVIGLSLIIVALAVVISLFATALSVTFSGLFSLVAGGAVIPTDPAVAVFYIGCGLFALGLGYILILAFYDLSKRIFILIAKLFDKIRVKIRKKSSNENPIMKLDDSDDVYNIEENKDGGAK